jgi:hypothetical protein
LSGAQVQRVAIDFVHAQPILVIHADVSIEVEGGAFSIVPKGDVLVARQPVAPQHSVGDEIGGRVLVFPDIGMSQMQVGSSNLRKVLKKLRCIDCVGLVVSSCDAIPVAKAGLPNKRGRAKDDISFALAKEILMADIALHSQFLGHQVDPEGGVQIISFLAIMLRRKTIDIICGVHGEGNSHLLELRGADAGASHLLRFAQSRQKHGCQNGNDGNHHSYILVFYYLWLILLRVFFVEARKVPPFY